MANNTSGASTTPRDTSVDIEAIRYDSSDGEDSHYYAVTWCLRVATAWVEGPVATDLAQQLAATAGLLDAGLSMRDLYRLRNGARVAVEFEYSPSVTSLVHVMTEVGKEPYILPLGEVATFARPDHWIQSAIKGAVKAHLEEAGGVQEVAA